MGVFDHEAQGTHGRSPSLARFLPSPKVSFRKAIFTVLFGLLCFLAGHKGVSVNNGIINRGRESIGLDPIYYYDARVSSNKPIDVNDAAVSCVPINPDPWIQQTASLMGEFYQLMQKMRYIQNTPDAIHYPPYSSPNCINLETVNKYKLEKQVVDLLQLLPYVNGNAQLQWSHGAADSEFILGGTFADFREEWALDQSRDPFYAGVDHSDESVGWDDEDGRYMRPYYVALDQLGNHGAVMILNTKNRHLWVVDQIGGQVDPGLDPRGGKETKNRNDLSAFESRPAVEVLRDLMKKFIDLEWIPGGVYSGGSEHETYKSLYIKHGWPNNFNGTAFDLARQQSEEDDRVQYDFEEPYRSMELMERLLKELAECPASCKLDLLAEEMAKPADPEESESSRNSRLREYENRKKALLRAAAIEDDEKEMWKKTLAVAKEEIEALPEEVRQKHDYRVTKFGW